MRIEDTDVERSTKEFEKNILDGFTWLGLTYDELTRQSERTSIYQSYVKKMIDNGSAYISKEEPKEEGQRSEVVRFKNPNKKVSFDDLVRGTVEFDTTELKDFVIAKSPEEPLYHLAVVVDDHEMRITHVIRGEDHISNTPRQILIQEAIGASRPIYAHLPLILDSERKKLSKRKHGEAVSVDFYKNQGFLPEALLNFLALLGWNPGTEQEIFSLDELCKVFDIERVQKSSAIFDTEKLKWINKEHMKLLPEETIKSEIRKSIELSKKFRENKWSLDRDIFERFWNVIFERIHTWKEGGDLIDSGEFDYVFTKPLYDSNLLFWRDEKDKGVISRHIGEVIKILQNLSEMNWNKDKIKDALWGYAEVAGKGSVLWPMRVALSGKEKSPDPFVLCEVLGKNETIERLNFAIFKLS